MRIPLSGLVRQKCFGCISERSRRARRYKRNLLISVYIFVYRAVKASADGGKGQLKRTIKLFREAVSSLPIVQLCGSFGKDLQIDVTIGICYNSREFYTANGGGQRCRMTESYSAALYGK